MNTKMAVCIFGEIHTTISLDHLDDDIDVFACVTGNIQLPSRVKVVTSSAHVPKYAMMERVAFLKRKHEISNHREYDVVYLCTPDNVNLIKRVPVNEHTIVAQILANNTNRGISINPNIVAGSSITIDLVALFDLHLSRMTPDVYSAITRGDTNNDANLFYDYICSRFINYENCDLFKRAS
jgi:hypothetical protein